jgi:hypothetical protein
MFDTKLYLMNCLSPTSLIFVMKCKYFTTSSTRAHLGQPGHKDMGLHNHTDLKQPACQEGTSGSIGIQATLNRRLSCLSSVVPSLVSTCTSVFEGSDDRHPEDPVACSCRKRFLINKWPVAWMMRTKKPLGNRRFQ